MKVLKPGHRYLIEGTVFDVDPVQVEKPDNPQTLVFIERENGKLINNGATNEEVLDVLINRMNWLQSKMPCRENAIVITKLEESLMWLNKRTEKRVAQGVETFDKPHE